MALRGSDGVRVLPHSEREVVLGTAEVTIRVLGTAEVTCRAQREQLDRQPARPSCASGHALRGTSRRKGTARAAASTSIMSLGTRPSLNQNHVFEIKKF